MNENRELSSNPYGDEQQVPYESWEEKKTPNQETQASTPPTPQISSAATPQQGQPPPAVAAPTQGQTPTAIPFQTPQWYGYYPYATQAVPAQTAALPKQNGYLQGLAITTIIGSALLIIIGLVGIPFTIIEFINTYFSNGQVSATDFFSRLALYLSATGVCLAGGGLSLYHSIRSILKKPSATVILPSFWLFLIPYILLLAGLFAIQIVGGEIPLVLLVLLLLVLVSPLVGFAFTAFNLHLFPISAPFITWRRMIVAFVSGATAPFLVITLLNASIDIGVSYAIDNCVGANPAPYCTNSTQFLTTTFILTTVIVLIIQETITPLLLAFYIRKVQRAGEALLLGLVCGTGFGIMESAAVVGNSYHDWIGILLTSLGMIVLNGTGGALVALGWYHILNPDHRQLLKASGYWLWAVVQQIIFNLLPIATLVPALDSFLKSWKTSLGTGIVSFYEIGYIVGVIIILAVFLYLMQRLRKEETLSLEKTAPSAEVVTSSTEVSSDVSEMSSDV
jgi:hypothetical protein